MKTLYKILSIKLNWISSQVAVPVVQKYIAAPQQTYYTQKYAAPQQTYYTQKHAAPVVHKIAEPKYHSYDNHNDYSSHVSFNGLSSNYAY